MSSTTFGVRPAVGQHPQANLQINQTHANQPTFDQVTASTIQQQARLVNDSFRTLANILQTVHVPTYEIHAFQGLYVWDKFQCTSPLLDYQILGWDQEEKVEAKSSFSFLEYVTGLSNRAKLCNANGSSHMAGEVYAIKVLRDQEERQYYINEAMLKQIRGLAPALEPGKWSESSTKELDFTEDDAGAVARLVEYLYTRDFDPRLRTAGFTPTIGLFGEQKDKAAMELVDFYCLLDRLWYVYDLPERI